MKVALLYPPEQNWSDTMCKPNGSLAYPMLGGALIEAGIEVKVFDAWMNLNHKNLVDYKKGMKVDLNTGEVH